MGVSFLTFHYATADRQFIRKSTKAQYAKLARMTGEFGQLAVDAITRADVESTLAARRDEGVAPSTVRVLMKFIRSTLRAAGNDCAAEIRVPVPAKPIAIHTADETMKLRAALEPLGSDAAFGLLILLATGIRIGELLGLRTDDWISDHRQLRIAHSEDGPTKSGKIRYIDVPDWIAERLDARGPVMKTSASTLRRVLIAVCDRAGVPRLKVHGLRHSRITQLLLSEAPILYVSDQAGHASPAFTLEVYGHLCGATHEQRRMWANL